MTIREYKALKLGESSNIIFLVARKTGTPQESEVFLIDDWIKHLVHSTWKITFEKHPNLLTCPPAHVPAPSGIKLVAFLL